MNGLKKVTAILLCVVLLGTAVISVRAANAVPKEVLRAAASAVRIIAEYEDDYACGSGFLVQNDAQGIYVLTNYHVVEDEPQAVYVLIGDEEIQVEVHAFSRQKDLCILSLPYAPAVEPVRFSAKDAVQGDAVYAVGFPAAADDLSDTLAHTSEDATITDGIVSALRTATTSEYGAAVKLLQINAAINPGNSGGPLFDEKGRLVGINTYSTYDSQGIFGAICVSEAVSFLAMNSISAETARAGQLHWMLLVGAAAAVLVLLAVVVLLLRKKRRTAASRPDNVTPLHVVQPEEAEPAKHHLGKRKKKRVPPVYPICAAILLVLLLAAGGYLYTYRRAVSYAENGDFADAKGMLFIPAITRIHDAKLADYLDAGILLEEGKAEEACAAFEALDGYRNAPELVLAAQYQQALMLAEQNEFAAAIDKLEELAQAGYEEAENAIQDVEFRHASYILYELDDYETAYAQFQALSNAGYPSAEEMCVEAKCVEAMSYAEDGYYPTAWRMLEKLKGNEKADALMEELKPMLYEQGIENYHSGDYGAAEMCFEYASGYKRSEDYIFLSEAQIHYDDASYISGLCDLIGFEDAAQQLVYYEDRAKAFLRGRWVTGDGGMYFSADSSGTIEYTIPFFDFGNQYEYRKGTMLLTSINNGDERVQHIFNTFDEPETEVWEDEYSRKLFEFTALSRDCIEIYCFADGNTYTLYRQ